MMTRPLTPSQTFPLAVKTIQTTNVLLPLSTKLEELLTPRDRIILCAFHLNMVAQAIRKYVLPVIMIENWSRHSTAPITVKKPVKYSN